MVCKKNELDDLPPLRGDEEKKEKKKERNENLNFKKNY